MQIYCSLIHPISVKAKDYSERRMKRFLAVICSLICFAVQTAAQISPELESITTMLKAEGFEEIRATVSSDTLFLSIEDETHRGTFRGAATAIKQIAATHNELTQFEVVLTDYKTPQLIVHASKREGLWNVSVDRRFGEAYRLLRQQTVTAKAAGKVDITLFPMFSLINNRLDHLFDYSLRIAPAVAMTLWQGARLTVQPIFPVFYRLSYDFDEKRYIQPGNINISQQWISGKNWHISSALGFFHSERMGIQTQVTWHPLRGLNLSVDAGLTGLANYDKTDGFGITPWKRFNCLAKADYYEPTTQVQVELTGGRFLFGDYGGRLDFTRHFGEYAIGAYAILTGGEHNAGFHFAIPLGGKRQLRKGYVRVRLPEYYSMEYYMQSYFTYWLQRMGETYVTQPDANRSAHYWEPGYVQHYIDKMLNGDFQ